MVKYWHKLVLSFSVAGQAVILPPYFPSHAHTGLLPICSPMATPFPLAFDGSMPVRCQGKNGRLNRNLAFKMKFKDE
uniref:Secreted protein n=1 Tax=Naja naja TaxID=35670 RepID=A0A8C6YBN1_NAJNA